MAFISEYVRHRSCLVNNVDNKSNRTTCSFICVFMTKLNLTFQPETGAILNILRQVYMLNIIKGSLRMIGKLSLFKNTREAGTKFKVHVCSQ